MKEYDWSEVVEYLNDNLDKEFDFGNAFYDDECCCLMASFFKHKGVMFKKVNYAGFVAEKKDNSIAAEVINCPFTSIEKIHSISKTHTMGSDIKKRLDEITNQN